MSEATRELIEIIVDTILFIFCIGVVLVFWRIGNAITKQTLPHIWNNSTISATQNVSDYNGLKTTVSISETTGKEVTTRELLNDGVYQMSSLYQYSGEIKGSQLVGEIVGIYKENPDIDIVVESMDAVKDMQKTKQITDRKHGRQITEKMKKVCLQRDGFNYLCNYVDTDQNTTYIKYLQTDNNGNIIKVLFIDET